MSKKTYLVTVDTYKGAKAPTTSRIADAVKKCQRHPLDFREVKVEDATGMVKPLQVAYKNPLYGIAWWDEAEAKWQLVEYFTTDWEARNAAEHATERCKVAGLDWEYSAMRFSPADHCWYSVTAAE